MGWHRGWCSRCWWSESGRERIGAGAVGIAALLACAGSLTLAVFGARENGGISIIDAAGVATFGVIAFLGFFGPSSLDAPLADFGRGGSAFVLAVIMTVSVFTVPFTEQYARDTIDSQYWASPFFRAKNKKISAIWAGVVFAMAICHVIAGALVGTSVLGGNPPGTALLNWFIPIALAVWAVKCTGSSQTTIPRHLSSRPLGDALSDTE